MTKSLEQSYTKFVRESWGLMLPLSQTNEIFPVYSTEYSSMIAYTLSSKEYYQKIQVDFKEKKKEKKNALKNNLNKKKKEPK